MTIATPAAPSYLDDGGAAFAPTGGGVQTGYGEVAGAAAHVDTGSPASAWNGVAILNVAAIKTSAGNEAYILCLDLSNDPAFGAYVTPASATPLVTGQTVLPVFNVYNQVAYEYVRLRKVLSGTAPSITVQAFTMPLSALSSLTQDELVQLLAVYAGDWQESVSNFQAWMTGTAKGGPNANGQYPLSDGAGGTVLVDCPAAIAALAGNPSTSGGGSSSGGGGGAIKVGPQKSFDAALSAFAFSKHTDYLFGTAVSAGAGQTAITNLTELAALYNPYEDFTGSTKVNSEQESYQPFNTVNHAFVSDRLNLTAVFDTSVYSGGYNTTISLNDSVIGVTPYGPVGVAPNNVAPLPGATINSIPIENLGWADTSHVVLGQMVAIQYLANYFVSQISENSSVQLTLLAGTPYQSTDYYNINVVMPYFCATLPEGINGAQSSTNQITVDRVPVGVTVGMTFAWASGGSTQAYADYRITAINGTTITISENLTHNVAAGSFAVFGPPITSGQIWSKEYYDFAGSTAWAFDFYVYFPQESNPVGQGFNPYNINTPAGAQAAPFDFPWGAWPALWFYSGQNLTSGLGSADSSEIDVVEGFYNPQYGPFVFNGTDHPGSSYATIQASQCYINYRLYGRNTGYSLPNPESGNIICPFSLASGQVRFSFIITPTDTYRYVNNVLLKWDHFEWTSPYFAQNGIDLACGSLNTAMFSILNDTGLNQMRFGISRVVAYKI